MNKPANNSDTTVFLVVLATIGLILPIMLCGAGVMLFGMSATRIVTPAPMTSATTSFSADAPSTLATPPGIQLDVPLQDDPDLDFQPTTLPPGFEE